MGSYPVGAAITDTVGFAGFAEGFRINFLVVVSSGLGVYLISWYETGLHFRVGNWGFRVSG